MQHICATVRTLPAGFSFVPSLAPKLTPARCYSTRRPGFFAQFFKNVQLEIGKSKEVKENVQKFREEAQKLEQSEALQAARQKFNTVESQASKGGQVLKQNVAKIQNRMAKALKDASDTELGKRLSETITQKGQAIGQSGALRGFSATARAVQQELDSQSVDTRVYRSPAKLQKRLELANGTDDTSCTTVQPNAAATAVELHKDSKFYQSWESFKTNNQHWNRLLALKIQYDESENVAIRTSRALTDKVSQVMGNLFSKTELSAALTEVCRIDPSFEAKQFLQFCERHIIPNVLESILRGELDVLRDWCFESAYSVIATPIVQTLEAGCRFESKLLDIENVELAMGQVMEQGPVLIVTFQAQQIVCVRDGTGAAVIEGDPEKVFRCHHAWVLCRDPSELNPQAAWRILQLSMNCREQFV
uniref:Mitochondrial import inner membrane translocase subunit TIM44 n=1 Tax=Anopheles coluzzii TaxID=1518534 RepID=A0A6E8VVK9_ANOCL